MIKIVNKEKVCWICKSPYSNQEHHVILQARGGKEGPTVWLCASCHAAAHASALARIDNLHVHFRPEHIERARPIVAALRVALTRSTEGLENQPIVTLIFKITPLQREILHQQKVDQGFTNLNEYLQYVIAKLTRTL